MTPSMSDRSLHTRRIVVSALFLALALVLRTLFRMYVPLMGESGIRLSIHGIFSTAPAILFGPFYGAMTSGLTDMVGHFISPSGAWIPWLTLTAVLGGFTRGWLWIALKNRCAKIMRIILACVGIALIAFGTYNLYAFRADNLTRDFYTRTPERRAAWEAGRLDAYGAFWHIQSDRTEHTDADGNVYWRTREDVWVTWGWVPGSYFPYEEVVDADGNFQTLSLRPRRRFHREPPFMSGTRIIIDRYGYNDAGEWGLRRSVYAPQSPLNAQGLQDMRRISRMAITRSFAVVGQTTQLTEFMSFTTWATIGSGGFFFLLLLLDFAVRKLIKNQPLPQTMALVLAMMIPAIMVSVMNTYILSQTVMTAWQLLPFGIVALPRALQSMATTTINIFFLTLLLGLCQKLPEMRALLRK